MCGGFTFMKSPRKLVIETLVGRVVAKNQGWETIMEDMLIVRVLGRKCFFIKKVKRLFHSYGKVGNLWVACPDRDRAGGSGESKQEMPLC